MNGMTRYRLFSAAAAVNLYVAGIAFGRGAEIEAIAFGAVYVFFNAVSMIAYDAHHGITKRLP